MGKHLLFLSVLFLLVTCKSPPPPHAPHVEMEDVPQQIVTPEFIITSITILQADLINTRLKLNFKIVNPNTVPLTLSSFRYELYGDGTFWANSMEKNLAVIPAKSSSETSVGLEMNFINMKRQLLNDIIAMREVRYRVVGDVELETDDPKIPGFRINFDYSGNSPVKH
jgi:LEA14-like dessication related protein